ncbi:hypothetical protein [Bradyrhizobium sp.]|uniref:hypothetical protein n=1 Tax=Bradyrhizobium sp. TaxID=376 RepID=UPI0040383D5B
MKSALWALAVSAGVALSFEAATAQGMQGRMGSGMMQGPDQQTGGREMMQGSGQHTGEHGMMRDEMGAGMQCMMPGRMHSGMMGQMGRGMMGSGMMGMMGTGMMRDGRAMTQRGMESGMGALFGSHVTPPMNLSVDDVRGYLGLRIDRLNNKRLKVGDLKSDDKTIAAEIVTLDNSLVQRLKVDRHTGAIEYEN